jgi:hypothetical protein
VTDDLEEQLRRLDPMHSGVPVESPTTPSSRARLETIMNTPLIDQDALHTRSARRKTWTIVAGVAAAALVAVGAAAIIGNSGGSGGSKIAAGPPLELSLGDSNTTSSCIRFDVALLAEMSPAFAGTATAVEGETVTLTVDHWYAGGDPATTTVVLHGSSGLPALIDGFQFEVGEHYLITAAEGNVNFCGFSGLATPELTAAFESAFGA